LESFSESPRVFHVHHFFSETEADALVDRILKIDSETDKLQQSHVGHQSGAKKVSPHRTSENAFDQVSDTAIAFWKRSFDLLRIATYQDDMCDGLQLLRYQQKQAYIPHTDYFSVNTSPDWNWNPQAGGSNRFATIFLYLSNVTAGGQTVFPHSYMPEDHVHPPESAEHEIIGKRLFQEDSWEYDMVQKCASRYVMKAYAYICHSSSLPFQFISVYFYF
jgi:prolyl 4-hydroxylase